MTDTPKFERNQAVWFRKFPQTENSPPNAIFKRNVGEINGRMVCEIVWKSEVWKVGEDEIKTTDQALRETTEKIQAEINQAKRTLGTDTVPKAAIARALRISETTLCKRMKLIQQHLQPKTT
jgi:hypothetical protein